MRRTGVWIAVFGFSVAFARGAFAAPEGGYLGVYLAPAEGSPGAVVEEVISGSPAEKAGLKAGDRIVGAGEREVASPEDLRKVVGAASPGDELPLKVVRGEESVGIRVSLGSPPEETPAPPKG
ncbi:MAG: PDZ domain-containing protein, partial [Planctomycetota bacterium]